MTKVIEKLSFLSSFFRLEEINFNFVRIRLPTNFVDSFYLFCDALFKSGIIIIVVGC